jgi:hypothetical protein
MCGAAASGFPVRGSYRQYFSDGYLDSGTDTDLRAENPVNLFGVDCDGALDFE